MANPDYFLRGSDGPVTSLTYYRPLTEPKDVYLLSGSLLGTVHVWYLKTRRIVHRFPAHTSSVLAIVVLNSHTILTHGRDGFMYSWQWESMDKWNKINSWTCNSLGFCAAAVLQRISCPSVILPSASHESAVDIIPIDGDSARPAVTLRPSENCIGVGMLMTLTVAKLIPKLLNQNVDSCSDTCTTVEEISDGVEKFIAGYEDGSLHVFHQLFPKCVEDDGKNFKNLPSEKCNVRFHDSPLTSVDFCPETQRGVSGSADGKLAAWIISDDGEIAVKKSFEGSSYEKQGVGCVRMRADGKLVVVGRNDGGISLYGGRKMTPLVTVCVHRGGVQSVAFDCDNSFAVGSADRIISIWSLYKC